MLLFCISNEEVDFDVSMKNKRPFYFLPLHNLHSSSPNYSYICFTSILTIKKSLANMDVRLFVSRMWSNGHQKRCTMVCFDHKRRVKGLMWIVITSCKRGQIIYKWERTKGVCDVLIRIVKCNNSLRRLRHVCHSVLANRKKEKKREMF